METINSYDNIVRVIQRLEIIRRDEEDFHEAKRLQKLISDMKKKLACAVGLERNLTLFLENRSLKNADK